MIKILARYYRPHMGLFLTDMGAALLLAVCDLFYPLITRRIINDYVPNRQLEPLVWICAGLLTIFAVKSALTYFVQHWGHVMGVRMQADMRRDLFAHVQRLPFAYFDENRTGSLMSRIVNDLMEITELAHHGPEDLFITLISLIGAFVLLGKINLWLTVIIYVFFPIVVLVNLLMRRRMQLAFSRRRETTAGINAEIENSISGIRVAKAFTNQEHEEEKFAERTGAYVKASGAAFRVMGSYGAGMSFGIDFLTLAALVASAAFFFRGRINIGDFTAFLLYMSTFTQPIRRLNQFMEQFQDGMSGFRRFADLLAVPPETNPEDPACLGEIRGEIVFEDVSFTYGDEGEVLSHVNLHVPAGKTLALVGPSGGGKTTLCHLIPRFYTPQHGRITLDGADIQRLDYTELRRSVGIVQQEVFIFAGTVRDNIAYGRLDATDAEIEEAAKKADLHDFVMSLPEGYSTYIGERGARLSGGQKQRVAIARVFLKNPPILILDEATSALDNVTEQAVQQAFDRLAKGRTTLVVAHRLSTVRGADEIVVLTGSGIAERGSHQELMAAPGGIYRTLYETQFIR
jgi:ATP-binding cassette subfamily B protein